MERIWILAGLAVFAMAPHTARAQQDTYASEGFLAELLCEGEVDGRSCGTDYQGAPMICGYSDRCDHPQPCLMCYRTAQPASSGALPVMPHVARLAPTPDQSRERVAAEHRLLWMERIAWAGMLLVLAGVVALLYLIATRTRGRAHAAAVLVAGIATAGLARWRQEIETRRIAATDHEREVLLVPFGAQSPLPRDHWASPAREAYEAQVAHLKRELEAKRVDWRKRAAEAGESPREY